MLKRFPQAHATEILSELCEVPFVFDSRDQALKRITQLGKDVLYSHTCSIVLFDLERSVLTHIACTSSNPEMERSLKDRVVHIGSGQPGDWIALDRLKADSLDRIYNLHLHGQGVANPQTARAHGFSSLLSYPLRMDGHLVGRFNSFFGRRSSFNKAEEGLIQILARLTVITLERFDHLQTRDKTQEIVSQLSEQLLSTQREDFLQLIADKGSQLLKVPVCIVWLLDPDGRNLRIAAASADVDEEFRKLEMSVDEPGIKNRLGPKISSVPNIVKRPDVVNAEQIKSRGWVSLLCASLRIGDKAIGLLDIFSKEERQFTIWEKESLETFAQHAALSLQKVKLLKEAGEKLEQLSELMLNMTQAGNVNDLLDIFLKGGLQLVDAKNGLIRRLDYATGYTRVVTHSDDPPPKRIELKLGMGITGLALKEGRPIRVDDLSKPEWKKIHVQAWEEEMRSELAIPIILNNATIYVGQSPRSGSKPIGVFNLESSQESKFSETDEKCLWSLSRYAALMIERLETDEKVSEIERIESEIAAAPNYDEVIQILLRGITVTLGYEYANISMVVHELNCIRSEHVAGIAKDKIERFKNLAVHQLDSKDIEADVVRHGHVEVPEAKDDRLNGKVISEFNLDLLSRVYVPIIEPSRNEVIGTLEAGYKKEFRPHIYERDVMILKRLVGYAAQALQRRRSGILDNLSHELRTPIVGIRSNASFLQRRLQDLDQHKIDAKFNDILADCQISLYQAAELEYVLGISSRTKSKFDRTLVHRDIIIKTIHQLKEVVTSRELDPAKMEYRKQDAGRIFVWTDRARLNQVVYNLLINAIKYAEKDPKQFTLRVEVDENRDSFIVKFKDWGIGIKKEHAHKVFDDGYRTPEAWAKDVTGSGLGLTISKRIMDQLGGDLKLVGLYKPTEFHLIIPKQQRS